MFEKYFLILIVAVVSKGSSDAPLVKTPLGKISGKIEESLTGKNFSAFEGIPYGKPPTLDKRFEPPEPVEPWLGVMDTTQTTKCAQTEMMHSDIVEGEEDCLHINVYVPSQKPNPKDNLDVIVHIHGGAYMYLSGDSYTNPDYILDSGAIFVTFNYRLGILGFLSTEDELIPGNNGLKDQVLALQWIQQNIQSFGGNPNSITLTGLSAGGSSVHLHYFSEMSKGLFNRGFSQSGVALNAFSLQEGALEKTRKLAQAVGCPTKDLKKLVSCLKQRPFKSLLKQVKIFFEYLFLPFAPFAPVVEKGAKPFLKENPYILLEKGHVLDVPWITSNTIHEGLFPALFLRDDLNTINNRWEELAPSLLDFNYNLQSSLWKTTSKKIKEFYLGKREDIDKENFSKFFQIFSDRHFVTDAETAVLLQAKANKSPVYYYYFGFPGDHTEEKHVMHGADGRYIFGNVKGGNVPMSDEELKMKDIIIAMLISFAKTGIPKIEGIDWPPTKSDELTFLNITGNSLNSINVQTVKELTPKDFWKSLNILENGNLVPDKKDEL